MTTEAHDRLIKAFQEYFKWQEKFYYNGSDMAGIKARYWLSQIRKEASTRRDEIQALRQDRKETRKGMVGRPSKVTKGV